MRQNSGIVRFVCVLAMLASPVLAENWPQWRGPQLNGVSTEKDLPVHWSTTENVVWKLAMPTKTGATPIVWGDSVFLNVADGKELYLWRVDKAKGTPVWKTRVASGNYEINKQNMSSPSPVTDGTNVYVLTGVGVLKGFHFAGKELWARDIQQDYGKFGLNWGYASSPLLYEDSLYVQVLHGMKTDDPSYLLRIDKKSGKTVWRVERPSEATSESPDSYRTPAVVKSGSRVEIVVADGDGVTGHDAATGKELWRSRGLNPGNNPANRVIASIVVADGLVYVPSRVRPLLVFRPGGSGDVSRTHLVWSFGNGPDVPTPVTDGKYFYSVNDRGIVWCLDAKTGAEIYGGQRIHSATYSSSPVLADGKIYITSEDGVTTVFRTGPKFEVLAKNDLASYTLSSVAISGGRLYLRTADFLYAIGKP
ncbi:MAG TPA: PQQ-binding-like beta-propeller repeat protein [Bryobacteraceae bacterium]|nr:PQQ-binding-like beta-propeller repeat protein [Bryobacteraceae bacterium]